MSVLSSLLLIASTPSWTMIGELFKISILLNIAHYYLHTVSCEHRIIVLDNGCILEYDSPDRLLADKKSTFFSMAKDAGLSA